MLIESLKIVKTVLSIQLYITIFPQLLVGKWIRNRDTDLKYVNVGGDAVLILATSIIYVEVLCCGTQIRRSANCKKTMLIIFWKYLWKAIWEKMKRSGS